MVNVEYARGFTDALEYIFNLFNKLRAQHQSTSSAKTRKQEPQGYKQAEHSAPSEAT